MTVAGQITDERLAEMLSAIPKHADGTVRSKAWIARIPAPDIFSLLTELQHRRGAGSHTANCCNCGRIIDTREEAEGGDKFGAEASDGRWLCSMECWDAVFRDEGPYATTPAVAAGGVTEEQVKIAARAMCRDSGFDPDEIMANDGPRWRYYAFGARAALTAALAVGDEGIREGDLVTAVWELLRTVHQPTPKAGSDYWHVTAGKHVEFGKLITKLHSLLDFPTPPSRGEGE